MKNKRAKLINALFLAIGSIVIVCLLLPSWNARQPHMLSAESYALFQARQVAIALFGYLDQSASPKLPQNLSDVPTEFLPRELTTFDDMDLGRRREWLYFNKAKLDDDQSIIVASPITFSRRESNSESSRVEIVRIVIDASVHVHSIPEAEFQNKVRDQQENYSGPGVP